jgi:preprotein translocase subunit SecD
VKPIGNRTAILIDGKVIVASTVREATDKSEKVDSFTKEEVEKIVAGMRIQ